MKRKRVPLQRLEDKHMNNSDVRSTTISTGLVLAALLLLPGCAQHDQQATSRTFGSPDDAVATLASALRANDTSQIEAILGSEAGQIISSGDEVADRQRRQKFLALYDQKHVLAGDADDRKTLVVGKDEWPFPVPIVRDEQSRHKWYFDTDAGLDEILSRRIGDNELSAIQVCEAIFDAQREYALKNPDGDGIQKYARQFASDPGKHNGLFWPTGEGEEPSPLGELAAAAAAEGYTRRADGPTPYHGYFYRILESQGPHAPNGALDYVVNGKMSLGFALLAYPAEYGNSGLKTFLMGPDGVVYQKDLGDDTPKLAPQIKSFDPGEGWTKVQ
jgi:hypothetical protein